MGKTYGLIPGKEPATCGACHWCAERVAGTTGECFAYPPTQPVIASFVQLHVGPRVELTRPACAMFKAKAKEEQR